MGITVGRHYRSFCKRVGAFALTDGSKDAVLYMNLDPGAYTAKVSGLDGTGVGLVELYDADLDPLASTCNLSNISTRGEVGTKAQILIAGFVVAGEVPKQVLVRGIGPRLADFQVDGTLVILTCGSSRTFRLISSGSLPMTTGQTIPMRPTS